ncbi:hypothetical protein [Corynebacterium sp. 13CS0277]|uniref:hypothetical protein n=1 Tax=Corynebacterium sp. 13CS0277 TaxID=2071994 RepID=UPI001304BE3F|nr:hypothetical protein [Corynebacterium sp. 13CS0277]
MDVKPQDFRAAQTPDPEALSAEVLGLLAQPTHSVDEEVELLTAAHQILADALR